MTEWLGISAIFAIAIILLIVEVFLPSHGLIGLAGLGALICAIYLAGQKSEAAGVGAIGLTVVLLPLGLWYSIRNYHRTPVGRRVSPPNPVLTDKDRMPVDHMSALVGRTGRTVTPLRPVGVCEFDGRRVECVAEFGMIESNVDIQGVRVVDRTLSVQPVDGAA